MFKLHNWVQELVQSFTFYGDRAGGGGTVGGGKPSSLAPQGQPNMPSQPMFAGGGRPFNLNPALVNYSRPPNLASQGMPTMPQGMNQPQGLPMQGGQFAGGGRPFNPQANQNIPYLMNFGGGRGPQGMPAMLQGLLPSQGLPMQDGQFAGGGGNPSSLAPQGQPMQQQTQPMFAGGGRPFSPQANQNIPYLINNKPLPNFTS